MDEPENLCECGHRLADHSLTGEPPFCDLCECAGYRPADFVEIAIRSGDDLDASMDAMGHAEFAIVDDEDGVIFSGRVRRLRTPRGRVLVPVEDIVGLLDAQIDCGGDLEKARRWLVNAAMNDNTREEKQA